jgi:ATP-binding cassette subfamily B protein
MFNNRFPLKETLKSYLPLKVYFLENWARLAVGGLCLLSVDLLQLLIPLVIRMSIDELTVGVATTSNLFRYGLIIILIAIIIGFLRYLWRYFLFGHSRKIEEKLRNRLYQHLQRLSLAFYQRTKTGDIMARATNDINAVRMASGMGLVAFLDGTIMGLGAIGFMLYVSPLLTLFALIPAPLIVWASKRLTRRMSSEFEAVQKSFADLTERVREAFAGIRVIKAYTRESWASQQIQDEGKVYVNRNLSLARTLAVFFPLMMIFTNLGLAIVILLGGRLTIFGAITPGDFVAFISYLNLLAWPMMALGWVTNMIQRGSASMRRINRILDEVPEIKDLARPTPVAAIMGHLAFKQLHLQLPDREGNFLEDISFVLESGKTLALVGRVGSGKTSLLNTLPRILDPPRGTVFIDGKDVKEIPLQILRNSIGFVTQDTVIFSDTIRNNVVFGREDISEAAVHEALKTAQIDEEIAGFDDGLDTILGERGITISGGQRQRLTIARALLLNPPILVLDDALSMVDTKTEEQILDRILGYRRNRTNIIVSHRLATISRADVVGVLDRGRLVELGEHHQLLESGQVYAQLYRRQLLSQELGLEVL